MFITWTHWNADRQSERTRIWSIRFVEKSLTAQFALRRSFARVAVSNLRPFTEAHCREHQVRTISSNHNCIAAELFDSINSVRQQDLVNCAPCPTRGNELRTRLFLHVAPAAAFAI